VGYVIDYDATNNILRVTLQDHVTDAALLKAYAAAAKYVASHGPCRGIWDISQATKLDVPINAIRQIAASPPIIPTGYMRIIVAQEDFVYGLMRMFQMLSDLTRPDLCVVRTIDEAYRLLRVESPEFSPIN
jgi:hypothetical protein